MSKIDCRGLACPQPVLRCKEEVDTNAPAELSVVVDNEAASQNVSRFLEKSGYAASVEKYDAKMFVVTGIKEAAETTIACDHETCEVMTDEQIDAMTGTGDGAEQKICVFITTDTIGRGDDELGTKLMAAFLSTLPELGSDLWRIVLLNGAVKLTTEDSPVVGSLQALEKAGVSILVCGTCLDFFDLLKKKAVGETTNMLDVVTSLQLASRIIRP